jgi:hypothetical protein
VASAWGSSWSVSWGNSWGDAGAVVAATAITTAGRRSAATSYRYRTLGSERREKERELAKLARRAQRKVAAAIESDTELGLRALVQNTVEATVPASVTWLTQDMRDSIVKSIVDFHRAQWARIQEQEDEEDIEVLLLAA